MSSGITVIGGSCPLVWSTIMLSWDLELARTSIFCYYDFILTILVATSAEVSDDKLNNHSKVFIHAWLIGLIFAGAALHTRMWWRTGDWIYYIPISHYKQSWGLISNVIFVFNINCVLVSWSISVFKPSYSPIFKFLWFP